MTKEEFRPGWQPSPPDDRDFTMQMAYRALGPSAVQSRPRKISNPYPLPTEDQGNIGACGAFTLAEERCITEYRQTGRIIRFSAGYHYVNRTSFWTGEGLIMRDAFLTSQYHGSVPYDAFPYMATYPELKPIFDPIEQRLREIAYPYRISSFFRLDGPGQDLENNIKDALANGMLVVTCFDIYESFWSIGADGIVPIPDMDNEKNYGGHATLTSGYDEDRGNTTDTQNHWGPKWGDNGTCHFPMNYPFREVWALSDKIDANLVKLQQIYTDADTIAPWARSAVVRANELGLMQGNNGLFNPTQVPTREQLAVVSVNLYDKIMSNIGK